MAYYLDYPPWFPASSQALYMYIMLTTLHSCQFIVCLIQTTLDSCQFEGHHIQTTLNCYQFTLSLFQAILDSCRFTGPLIQTTLDSCQFTGPIYNRDYPTFLIAYRQSNLTTLDSCQFTGPMYPIFLLANYILQALSSRLPWIPGACGGYMDILVISYSVKNNLYCFLSIILNSMQIEQNNKGYYTLIIVLECEIYLKLIKFNPVIHHIQKIQQQHASLLDLHWMTIFPWGLNYQMPALLLVLCFKLFTSCDCRLYS